jgi:hypothetical protein
MKDYMRLADIQHARHMGYDNLAYDGQELTSRWLYSAASTQKNIPKIGGINAWHLSFVATQSSFVQPFECHVLALSVARPATSEWRNVLYL